MQRTETVHVQVKLADWTDEAYSGTHSDADNFAWRDSLYDEWPMLAITLPDGRTLRVDDDPVECVFDMAELCGQWRIKFCSYWDDDYFRNRQMVEIHAAAVTSWNQEIAGYDLSVFHRNHGLDGEWSFDIVLTYDVSHDDYGIAIAKDFKAMLVF